MPFGLPGLHQRDAVVKHADDVLGDLGFGHASFPEREHENNKEIEASGDGCGATLVNPGIPRAFSIGSRQVGSNLSNYMPPS